MKLLITTATVGEIQPLRQYLEKYGHPTTAQSFQYGEHEIFLHASGVGIMSTTYSLTRLLANEQFDFALQVGVSGSFDKEIELGQVVLIQSEMLGDTGAEDHDGFLDLFELELSEPDQFPFSKGKLECPLHTIPFPYRLLTVSGLTVNTVSGRFQTIQKRKEQYVCQVESMEGAAFHFVCLQESVAFAQIRAISNYILPRDRESWKLQEAVLALNHWLIELLNASWK